MKVLVTGGTGFVGSHVAQAVAEQGGELRLLVRSASPAANLEHIAGERVVGDLCNPESLRKAVAGNVSATDATPDELVIAITFAPLVVPFDNVPALVLNNMLAPLGGVVPPELPGARFTESATGSVVPCAPV